MYSMYDSSTTTTLLNSANSLRSYILFRERLKHTHTNKFPGQLEDLSPDNDVSETSAFSTREILEIYQHCDTL